MVERLPAQGLVSNYCNTERQSALSAVKHGSDEAFARELLSKERCYRYRHNADPMGSYCGTRQDRNKRERARSAAASGSIAKHLGERTDHSKCERRLRKLSRDSRLL